MGKVINIMNWKKSTRNNRAKMDDSKSISEVINDVIMTGSNNEDNFYDGEIIVTNPGVLNAAPNRFNDGSSINGSFEYDTYDEMIVNSMGDVGVKIYKGCYVKLEKEKWVQITNFIIRPKGMMRFEDGNREPILKVTIINRDDKSFDEEFPISTFEDLKKFRKIINKHGLDFEFEGSNKDLYQIRKALNGYSYDDIIGTEVLGFHKVDNEYLFVSNDRTINRYGDSVESIKLVDENKFSNLLGASDPISRKELLSIGSKLLNFNDLTVTTPIIGFLCYCFAKQILKNEFGIKGTGLMITGEAGAGKSQTMEFIMRKFFGIDFSIIAGSLTRASTDVLASMTNAIAIIIDELKPYSLSKQKIDIISNLCRNSYDENNNVRSTSSLEINQRKYNSIPVLLGEMPMQEPAIKDRMIHVYFSKNLSKKDNRENNFLELKSQSSLLTKLGKSVILTVLKLGPEALYDLREKWRAYAEEKVEDRNLDIILNLGLGIELLKQVFDSLDIEFSGCTGYSVEELIESITSTVLANNLEGAEKRLSNAEKTLEVINQMVGEGYFMPDRDFHVNRNGKLQFRFAQVYEQCSKYLKAQNMKDFELLDSRELIKQMKLAGYAKTGTIKLTDEYGNKIAVHGLSVVLSKVEHLNLNYLMGKENIAS